MHNSAYFEHALLARLMGVELVEGRDLVCRAGRVMMRTTIGLQPVHVIYRRVDDEFLDPVHFRAGLAARLPRPDQRRPSRATSPSRTRSATASPTTSCVYTYVPDLIRYYLARSRS